MTTKRERDLERAKQQRQAEKDALAASRRRNVLAGVAVAAVLVLVGGYFVVASLGDDEPDTEPTAQATSTPTASANVADCDELGDLQTSAKQFPDGPQGIDLSGIAPDSVLGLQIETNCGDIEIAFDRRAERTVESMIFLANTGASICEPIGADCSGENPEGTIVEQQGYFDNTQCHRLTTEGIFVLQCGDPNGDGTGGPGYSLAEENLPAAGEGNYPRGTIAMANAGPNTTGSQFFIVYQDTTLPPDYTILGRVSVGLEIIDLIAEEGTADQSADGPPAQPLELVKVNSFERRPIE